MENQKLAPESFSSFSGRRGRRVMICVRGQCAPPDLGKALEKRLLALITEHGLDNPEDAHYTTCTLTNCLAVCEAGPVMIVHPEGVKYQRLTVASLERIFKEHLLGDRPVAELIVRQQPSRSIWPPKKRRAY